MKFFYERKFRERAYQVILIVFLAAFFWLIFQNTFELIETLGIATGFDFLKQPAGFEIIQTLIDYTPESTYGRVFIVGLLNTIVISVIGIILATFLGCLIGIARLSQNFLVSSLAASYVSIFRNVPLLLQIFFWYHAVLKPLPGPRELHQKGDIVSFSINNRGFYFPKIELEFGSSIVLWGVLFAMIVIFFLCKYTQKLKETTGKEFPLFSSSLVMFFGLPLFLMVIITILFGFPFSLSYAEMERFELEGGFSVIPEFISLLLALTIYTASFIAEIVRSGIQAVDYGQTEAANSMALKKVKILRLVILPQALRIIIPPLISQYLNLTKNSSLAAAIAYPEIVSVFAGIALNQTGQALEIIAMTMAIYLLLSLSTSMFLNWYNRRIMLKEK